MQYQAIIGKHTKTELGAKVPQFIYKDDEAKIIYVQNLDSKHRDYLLPAFGGMELSGVVVMGNPVVDEHLLAFMKSRVRQQVEIPHKIEAVKPKMQYIVTYPHGTSDDKLNSEIAEEVVKGLQAGRSLCIPIGWTVQAIRLED
jgi:hypothetical protein